MFLEIPKYSRRDESLIPKKPDAKLTILKKYGQNKKLNSLLSFFSWETRPKLRHCLETTKKKGNEMNNKNFPSFCLVYEDSERKISTHFLFWN